MFITVSLWIKSNDLRQESLIVLNILFARVNKSECEMDYAIRFALITFSGIWRNVTQLFCCLTLTPHRKTPFLIISFFGLINSTELMCCKLSCVL